VLETLCSHGRDVKEPLGDDIHASPVYDKRAKHERVESNETQCTIDITTPEDMDSFMSTANLTKDDEQRLRYFLCLILYKVCIGISFFIATFLQFVLYPFLC